MNPSILLGIGTGRCGLASLAKVLHQQTDVLCSHDEPPRLPWKHGDGRRVMRERFARFRRSGEARLLGDCASFYLPYVEDAIAEEPEIRIVCLRRPREEVVADFGHWVDRTMPLPTNHWARLPAPGWHHDPVRTRTFPQYDTQDREEGIRLYWDEYDRRVDELTACYPENVRRFDRIPGTRQNSGDTIPILGKWAGFNSFSAWLD